MDEDARTAPTRLAGRLLIVDAEHRVLLFSCADPARPEDGHWWFTPGGGVEPGESVEQGARREALEETGLEIDELGPPVHERQASFDFEGVHYEQLDVFFLVRVGRHAVDTGAFTADERRVLTGHRWWSATELAATSDTVYPVGLLELMVAIGAFAAPS